MARMNHTAAAILTACAIAVARDPAALKADLTAILPQGKTSVRLAWIKGGSFTEFAANATNTAVYVVGSDDGVIRRLYPASGSGRYFNVNITADGKRVLFYNGGGGNLVVVNWDGSGARNVSVGGFACEYWRHPTDGTDWSIVATGGMSRVNIDQPSQRVQVGSLNAGEDGPGLSDDGTKFMYYDYNRSPAAFGVAAVPGLQFTAGPHGGCQGSLGAGSSPVYNHNPSGHTQMCVHEVANQSRFTLYPVVSTVKQVLQQKGLTGSCQGDNIEGTRFTQQSNFASTMIGNSKVNPILLRLPDMKFVYIEDGLACTFCGDMDAVFLPYTGAPTLVAPDRRNLVADHDGLVNSSEGMETFLPDGRSVGPVFISGNGPGRACTRVLVVRGTRDRKMSGLRKVLLTR